MVDDGPTPFSFWHETPRTPISQRAHDDQAEAAQTVRGHRDGVGDAWAPSSSVMKIALPGAGALTHQHKARDNA